MNCSIRIFEAAACIYHSFLSRFEGVDWVNEARLLGTATLLAGIILFVILHIPVSFFAGLGDTLSGIFSHISNSSVRHARMPPSPAPLAQPCFGVTCPYNSTVRAQFTDSYVCIYAWPSRGGVIVLDNAEAIDFEFLELNPLDPPVERLDDQAAEDAFCQRLLHLGAKWWDSEARYSVVAQLEVGGGGRAYGAFPVDEEPPPTMCEKRFVKVGWPSTGGLWVAEFDTTFAGVDEEENLLPDDEGAARVRMARSMDERCTILRDRFKATFYESLKDYKGYAFLNSWEMKETGEVGPLLQPNETIRLWQKAMWTGSKDINLCIQDVRELIRHELIAAIKIFRNDLYVWLEDVPVDTASEFSDNRDLAITKAPC